MRYLIVNADDFGYSFSVNKGIIEAHSHGIVTSTSVMVDTIAAHEAAQLAKFPKLSVGLHFVVKNFNHVRTDLERQIAKFVSIVGVPPDHLDTHKVYTTNENIKDILLNYSEHHKIPVRGLGPVKFIDSYFGFHSGGDVSLAQLQKAIDRATDEYNEVMCHVGYVDDYLREHSSYSDPREQELTAICNPTIKTYIAERGLELCNWKQIK